jgi:hypothetical protein
MNAENDFLTSWECWWLAMGDLFGCVRIEIDGPLSRTAYPRGPFGEFFMRKAGLRKYEALYPCPIAHASTAL